MICCHLQVDWQTRLPLWLACVLFPLRSLCSDICRGMPTHQTLSPGQLCSTLQVLQEQLETADLALQDSQQMRMEYDRMCQQAYELSRKLSQAQSAKGELQRELADARCGWHAAAACDERMAALDSCGSLEHHTTGTPACCSFSTSCLHHEQQQLSRGHAASSICI